MICFGKYARLNCFSKYAWIMEYYAVHLTNVRGKHKPSLKFGNKLHRKLKQLEIGFEGDGIHFEVF